MQQFERPDFTIEQYVEDEHYGKFVLSPLERGFGTTIGNAIRRVLLASMPGGAVYSIKVDGVYHEFTAIPGIVEDVTAIILNIKNLILAIDDDESYTLRINAVGETTVTAGDIICPTGVEVLNPDLVICHIAEGGKLEMELRARKGRGYLSSEENKAIYQGSSQGLGTIYTDSIFTPVKKASFEVNPTRVKQNAKYDSLTLENNVPKLEASHFYYTTSENDLGLYFVASDILTHLSFIQNGVDFSTPLLTFYAIFTIVAHVITIRNSIRCEITFNHLLNILHSI